MDSYSFDVERFHLLLHAGLSRRFLKDRMDITGARWGLAGAEAILTLRALITNGDFDQYWTFHLAQEHRRVHAAGYALGVIPAPA